jgi:EAL domain-containing protein (putative c-di-GMP-specific phosphodiesterase class I)
LSRLTIEITESSLILDLERVSTELLALRALGIGVAIDDFGTGYSSLAQLQDLPATALKIDRGLVQRDGVVGQTIIELILQLATGLGLRAVAEGVETPEQLLMLTALGCSHAQGFLFSPALPYRSALALAAEFA